MNRGLLIAGGLLATGLLLTAGGPEVPPDPTRRKRLVWTGEGAEDASSEEPPPAGEFVLRTIEGYGKKVRLRNDAADALADLIAAARADGIDSPLLLPVSGYRTFAEQERLWQQGVAKHGSEAAAKKWVAPPGYSPHQTGRAVDLWLGYQIGSGTDEKMRSTAAYRWLTEHAQEYSFFPYTNEAWHWEYGAPHSTDGTYAREFQAGKQAGYLV